MLIVEGFQIPIIPFCEVVGSVGTAEPVHIIGMGLNIGFLQAGVIKELKLQIPCVGVISLKVAFKLADMLACH